MRLYCDNQAVIHIVYLLVETLKLGVTRCLRSNIILMNLSMRG